MKVAMLGFAVACLLVSGTAFASEELAKSSNCLMCHPMDKKGMGPGMNEIAAKYKGNAEGEAKIVEAIVKGSKGVYGENSNMPAQAQVKEADAKTLATWIMSLAADKTETK